MAKVYDRVKGVKGGTVSHAIETRGGTTIKYSAANSVERVMAMHENTQNKLREEGMKVFQRAKFRMEAVQARHVMRLREALNTALKTGDPDLIKKAQGDLDYYNFNKTAVIYAQADIDFHIMLYRPDGKSFFVEVDGDGNRGFDILKKSLTG